MFMSVWMKEARVEGAGLTELGLAIAHHAKLLDEVSFWITEK